MFVESLIGNIIKLRKPVIQDSIYWGIGVGLSSSTRKDVEFINSIEFEENYTKLQNELKTIYWSIENKENKQYFGIISVHATLLKKSEIHISLSNPNYKGRETSLEAISLVLNYLKYKASINEVIIRVGNKNKIMIRVLESAGFVLKSSNANILIYQTYL